MEIHMANELNKIEKQVLKQVNLNEGILTKILAKIYKPKVDRVLKKMIKGMMDDPDLQAKLASIQQLRKELERDSKDYCKKRPQSPLCKDGKRKSIYN
jgi:hypothetical protein